MGLLDYLFPNTHTTHVCKLRGRVPLNPLLAKQGLDILQLMENNQINENNIKIQGEQN